MAGADNVNVKKAGIKPTLTKGVARVPVVMQLEALECGAAALCMVMAYYGKWVPLEQVRQDCGVSRDGSKAKTSILRPRTTDSMLMHTVCLLRQSGVKESFRASYTGT